MMGPGRSSLPGCKPYHGQERAFHQLSALPTVSPRSLGSLGRLMFPTCVFN